MASWRLGFELRKLIVLQDEFGILALQIYYLLISISYKQAIKSMKPNQVVMKEVLWCVGGHTGRSPAESTQNRSNHRLLVDQHDTLELNAQLFQVPFVLSDLADLSSDKLGLLLGASVAVHGQFVLGPRGHLQLVFLRDQLVDSSRGR